MSSKKKLDSLITISPIKQILSTESVEQSHPVILYELKNGATIEFAVKPLLTLAEMQYFIATVTESAFVDGEYTPMLVPFMINQIVIECYLQCDDELDDDERATLKYSSTLIEEIHNVINQKQFEDILSAIEYQIEFRKNQMLSEERKMLARLINDYEILENEINRHIESFAEIAKQFEGIDIKETLDTFKKIANKSNQDFVDSVLEFNKES